MNIARPEVKLERLLGALEQELLEVSDEEILSVATELGLRPGMKGSVALAGVLMTMRMSRGMQQHLAAAGNKTARRRTGRARRRPKDDPPGT